MSPPLPADPVTLADIEAAARVYSASREKLGARVAELEQEVAALKRRHMSGLMRAVERAAADEEALTELVTAAPELFTRPRTHLMHGIKVGWTKGKGAIEIADAARTVELIRRHLADQADALIRTTETPHRPALAQLSVADLKRIGCTVVDAVDAPLVRPMDGELQRLIDRLLADATEAVEGVEP